MKDYLPEIPMRTVMDSHTMIPKHLQDILGRVRNEIAIVLLPQLRLGSKALVCGAFLQEVGRKYGIEGSKYAELYLTNYIEQYSHAKWLSNGHTDALRLFIFGIDDSLEGVELHFTDAFVTLFQLHTVNGVFHRRVLSTSILF